MDISKIKIDNSVLDVKDGTARATLLLLGTASVKDAPASGNASNSQVVLGNDTRLSDPRPASDVYEWAKASTKPTYTKSDVGLGNVTNDSQVKRSEMGAASGVATLDSTGKVPSTQLPSYVDDVIEGYMYNGKFYAESTHETLITGESGKIYLDLSTSKIYRWGGSAFAVISDTITVGTIQGTAFDGKSGYDHVNNTSNPHSVTKSQVGLGNVGNFKAVSTVASQDLTDAEKSNARANIGAGTSSFSGSYTDLTNKPTIPDAQIQSDWDLTNTSAKDYIKNKPSSMPASDVSSWAKASTKPSYNLDEISDGTNKKWDDKADKEGYFPNLHAGLADNMFGSAQTNDQFMFRPTAGIQDIESGEAPLGGGTISKIEGNTVKWNQRIYNGNFVSTIGWNPNGSTITANDNELVVTATEEGYYNATVYASAGIQGYAYEHKMFYSVSYMYANAKPIDFLQIGYRGTAGVQDFPEDVVVGEWKTLKTISTINFQDDTIIQCYLRLANIGDVCRLKNFHIIDLTLMFGEGNEPSTVEEFESWLETNIGLKDYYPYNEGELIPVKDYKVKSVGFNAWDEEWELGYYDFANGGVKVSGNDNIRCKDCISVMPNTSYYFKGVGGVWLAYLDKNKTAIGGQKYNVLNSNFTTPSNCHYILFYMHSVYGTTYNNDICINLSYDDDKDGTYEEHWEHEAVIPTTKIYGKLNGSGEYVQVFPDGMKKAGSIADVLDLKNGSATRKLGSVDLGSLSWVVSYDVYCTSHIDDKKQERGNVAGISSAYPVHTINNWGDSFPVNSISIGSNDTSFAFKSSETESPESITTKMQGVMLYYELETPLTYTDLIIRDNGVDTPLSEIAYKVDNYGTEEIILGNDTSVVSCTPTMTIKYGINATDALAELPHSYVSGTGNQNFSEAQKELARNNIGAGTGVIDKTIETTWANLKSLRDNSQLIPGQFYRITDYACTTTQENTQSAGHQFDIIVRADDVNVLNENALAAKHAGDTYFTYAGAKLEAWELKYCLDNDTARFAWADTTNGKGVIYRMIDENNNDIPYDFKNIQFMWTSTISTSGIKGGVFYYTFSVVTGTNDSTVTDFSFNKRCYNNKINIKGSSMGQTRGLNFITFRQTSDSYSCYGNTFGYGCYNNTFGNGSCCNTFGDSCQDNTFGGCIRCTFGGICTSNMFSVCTNNTFGFSCSFNTDNNIFSYNIFGNYCYYNTFGDECKYNTFGNSVIHNTFGNYCQYNTFGNECQYNTLPKSYSQYNIFENGNKYITLTSTQTTSSSNTLRNIKICQGVNNTTTTKTISHNTLNDTFQTEYKPANSQVISV